MTRAGEDAMETPLLNEQLRKQGLNSDADWVSAEFARRLERVCRMQHEALLAFGSGANWGKRKAWLVNGAPSREEGITEAQAIVREQMLADEALRAYADLGKESE